MPNFARDLQCSGTHHNAIQCNNIPQKDSTKENDAKQILLIN